MKIVEQPVGAGRIILYDFEPTPDRICDDVTVGLARRPRMLPSKYFYDDAGAELFQRITGLDVYYPTRTEVSILERCSREIADRVGPNPALIEFGSGSGEKTWIMLRNLHSIGAYVPVDISRAQLIEFALRVATTFPELEVRPVCADYTAEWFLPRIEGNIRRRVAFFPGSTIGNFERAEAVDFLRRVRRLTQEDGGMLLGLDLLKDSQVIERAYNDPEGVTAEFNLNLLTRLNRECGADFDASRFRHFAFFDESAKRVEMRLVSMRPQTVRIRSDPAQSEVNTFDFETGDYIVTEYSHKYDLADFASLAAEADWEVDQVWTDEKDWFGVVLLR